MGSTESIVNKVLVLLASDISSPHFLHVQKLALESTMLDSPYFAQSPCCKAYERRDFAQALELAGREGTALDPNSQEALGLKYISSLARIQLEEYDQAIADLFQLWTVRDRLSGLNVIKIQYNIALAFYKLGQMDSCRKHLDFVLKDRGQVPEILSAAHRLRFRSLKIEDPEAAMDALRLSLEHLPPESGDSAQIILAMVEAAHRNDQQSFKDYQSRLDNSKLSPMQHNHTRILEMVLLARLGKFNATLKEFKTFCRDVDLDSLQANTQLDLLALVGHACANLGLQNESLQYLDRAYTLFCDGARTLNPEIIDGIRDLLNRKVLEEMPFELMLEHGILGTSPPMLSLKRELGRIHAGDLPVLIHGESGCGKELLARSFARSDRPFVAINCRSLPTHLLPSLLFGHAKGAFTGAREAKRGFVEEADGGILFLDEVGDLPLEVQPTLFRFLDDGSYYRVGESQVRHARVRLIAASNLDLSDRERMRSELYNRLAGFTLRLPPLRERGMDVVYLAAWFVKGFNERNNRSCTLGLDPSDVLLAYHWPGNVRELRFLVERACTLSPGDLILNSLKKQINAARQENPDPESTDEGINNGVPATSNSADAKAAGASDWRTILPRFPESADSGFDLRALKGEFIEAMRRHALQLCDGNIRAAARMLMESPTGIQRMLQKDQGRIDE